MKVIANLICLLLVGGLFASEVRWNCFSLHDLGEPNCVGCYYYDNGYSSPEIGLQYVYDQSGGVLIDGKGPSNIGWNVALWVDAVAGDILDRSYFSKAHIVLKDSYNRSVPTPIQLNVTGDALTAQAGDNVYLALIGNYYDDNGNPMDYYGWVEIGNTGTDLVVLESAFSYGNLVVGGGAVPEPSSGLLCLVGLLTLMLRRPKGVGSLYC